MLWDAIAYQGKFTDILLKYPARYRTPGARFEAFENEVMAELDYQKHVIFVYQIN